MNCLPRIQWKGWKIKAIEPNMAEIYPEFGKMYKVRYFVVYQDLNMFPVISEMGIQLEPVHAVNKLYY